MNPMRETGFVTFPWPHPPDGSQRQVWGRNRIGPFRRLIEARVRAMAKSLSAGDVL